MSTKAVLLTIEGKEALEQELKNLKSVKRQEISARIKEAISLGDLSENSEYNEAKLEQAACEMRISELEETLTRVEIIQMNENKDVVSLGTRIVLRDIEYNEDEEYIIVGSAEANPRKGRISNESPVGQAVIGKKKGDIIEVSVPVGTIKYEIVDIK
ncbi:transcription elongation factor GreA [Clostridium sp. 'deep sea']|uniref:transcription elongation factor GreA n=1 Tax=Clostridium sp. 'deep sea' TaxID=2779445 RepID=UPI0018969B29|nr:transcription elongation factor GreA [Clostridium sp. 'deep sea']QOR33821.1 transcription elongation factor GreA [Clostridium sp. 'deep sea']